MSEPTRDDAAPQQPDEVEALAVWFLERIQAGEQPDREAVVRAHPHLGDRLARRLAHVEMMCRVGLGPEPARTSAIETTAFHPPNADAGQVPTVAAGATASAAGDAPRNLPDYEILTKLGHGGMGVVYKARQKSLNRIVALKMIRAGSHAGPDLRARFHIEAEALASLHHPHIVQIYEVGEHDSCPFMAMEYVDGGTLAKYLAGHPQPSAEAAALAETLARAMHAAHQCGIVHRDLKPTNVLLQKSEPVGTRENRVAGSFIHRGSLLPKITDFGLAKRLAEEEGGTTTGAVLGTPSYMAPEQAGGRIRDIGPPTDVYALGAILYEMLTGKPPFVDVTPLAVLKRVESETPAAPSRLYAKLPRDLETICLKCLEKEPARRYPTAEDLAEDLRRFQAGEPIMARPAGVGERAWKWVKRRPALAALIAVSCAAAFALAVVGISWSLQVQAERDRARHSLQVARKAIDDLYTKMASERLFDEPQLDPLCQELLAKARSLYEELAAEHSDLPEVRRDIALAWFRLGDIHRQLDQHAPAEQAYGQAIVRQEALHRDDPQEPRYSQELANSHNWLGELFREHNQLEEAEQHYRAALALQQDLMRQFPQEPIYGLELARSQYNLGIVHKETNRLKEAEADYGRAVDLLTTLNPAEANVRQDLARALINRGVLHRLGGRPEKAGQDYDKAIGLLAGLRDQFPARAAYRFELAIAWQDRGNLFWSQGRHVEAQRKHQEALAVLRVLVTDFSHRPRYKKKMASALINLGSALASAHDPAGAENCWNQARSLLEVLAKDYPHAADHHGLLGMTLGNLGWLRTEQKKWAEAQQLTNQSLAQMKQALAPNTQHPNYRKELRNQYRNLAWTQIHLGDHAGAVQAAKAMAAVFPEQGQDTYFAACFIARCVPLAQKDSQLSQGKRQQRARDYVNQAVALLRETVAKAPPRLERIKDERDVFSDPEFDAVLARLPPGG
jgi:tetratricopeptide (TPR) repeat protein/tRNA A-37 threonylcarbamoyl transferase component Bud32